MKRPHFHGHRQRLRERFLKSGLAGFGEYEVVVVPIKVIDIFGNDTSQAFDLGVR